MDDQLRRLVEIAESANKHLLSIEKRLRAVEIRVEHLPRRISPRKLVRTITLGVASGIILAILVLVLLQISLLALGFGIGEYLSNSDPNRHRTRAEMAEIERYDRLQEQLDQITDNRAIDWPENPDGP